ncbi:hypothetical protein PSTT_03969 [Puccinia striiformis]|uniref:Uncharacterized protein n=1 Tax=Puccinia striiformis TaxID=27350 RepID=A0A2S4VUN6_9BASI|nr:hypothetical protein PSTT_03969 [Puccinia striiformis]
MNLSSVVSSGSSRFRNEEGTTQGENERAQCWIARDEYYGCLAQDHQQKRKETSGEQPRTKRSLN